MTDLGKGVAREAGARDLSSASSLFRFADKVLSGQDGSPGNPAEAFHLFKRAAELGLSDAFIRIGEMHETGRGVPRDDADAIMAYTRATAAGNALGYAYLARLFARRGRSPQADMFWDLFFNKLPEPDEAWLFAAEPEALIHGYIRDKLEAGEEPKAHAIMVAYWDRVVAYARRRLEHIGLGPEAEIAERVEAWIGRHR